jgi:hypothetical protein
MSERYVPSDDQVRGRYSDGAHIQGADDDHLAAFDAWLAQVRRDAAREALDGLAKAELDRVAHISKNAYPAQIAQGIAQAAWNHKWRHYGGAHPEEDQA